MQICDNASRKVSMRKALEGKVMASASFRMLFFILMFFVLVKENFTYFCFASSSAL
jgi:hypothetical protein